MYSNARMISRVNSLDITVKEDSRRLLSYCLTLNHNIMKNQIHYIYRLPASNIPASKSVHRPLATAERLLYAHQYGASSLTAKKFAMIIVSAPVGMQ